MFCLIECMSLEEVCKRFKKDFLKQEPFVPDSNGKVSHSLSINYLQMDW